jgi:RHS repeat-associated protein
MRWGSEYRCDGIAVVSTVQRYYASSYGRFNTPDPYKPSASPKNPGSWNRYTYVLNDPVNHNDPRGLDQSVCTDPDDPDCPAAPEPDPCWDLSLGLFDGSVNCGAPVSGPVASGDDGSTDGDSPPPCPQKFQAYINSYGAYATATGLSPANVLALSAIESGFGGGRFATGGNSFFNLETLSPVGWQPGNPLPATKYADQVSWMNALEPFTSGPNAGRYSLVATYKNASDAFASFAAQDGQAFSGVTDPAKFGQIAVGKGIYAGRGNGFITTEQTFAQCLGAQSQ